MKIAVEGCAHGELETIYETLLDLERKENVKIDLLICCGDFQATRNEADLRCMAVPPKYYNMCTFYKYYTGEKVAPILTVFIGGNHEASNYLQELPYGGWVAPNIYYMGYAGVINIAGIRIGGVSGIYKSNDYMKGRHEHPPYSENSKRSVYHYRNLEFFRLKQLSQKMDIFISHDWPHGVWNYGNKNQLLRFKPHFQKDIDNDSLGSKPLDELLRYFKPKYWFAAHLHCKFAAVIPHDNGQRTKFLSLDKCLPKRRFLQVFDLEHNEGMDLKLEYDWEWLAVLRSTNHLLSTKNCTNYLPGPNGNQRWEFTPTEEEKTNILLRFENDMTIPKNFSKTAESYVYNNSRKPIQQPLAVLNPQTVGFCSILGVDDPVQILLNLDTSSILSLQNSASCIKEDEETSENEIECEESPISVKRTSLKLPKPVNEVQENEVELLPENQKRELSETVESAIPEIQEIEPTPKVKKFRRRNCEIYENTDDTS